MHGVLTVGDAENKAQGLQVFAHQPTGDCECDNCTHFRDTTGCQNPHECYVCAGELLDELPFKWDPCRPQPEDYEVQEDKEPDDNGWVIFDRSITTTGPLANIFRIFTEGQVTNNLPDMRLDDTFAAEETVPTDGSCFNNSQDDAAAGARVFYEEGDDRNEAIRLPEGLEQSNQTAEMVAIKEAV
jgi:hypothetical protein